MFKKVQSIAFILAGGSGTRLAPLSLTSEGKLPKQFLALAKRRTMLQEAVNRIPKDIPMVIIPEEKYKEEVAKQTEGLIDIIAEPFGCNTATAVGLAAVYALQKGYSEKTVLFIVPADHYMDTRYFRKYFDPAVEGAAKGRIVTIGITPDRPETGYGYIKTNKKMQTIFGQQPLYEVVSFEEKPDVRTAARYLESGEYFWNAGIFALTIEKALSSLATDSPVIFQAVQHIKEALGTPQEAEVMRKEYQAIKEAKANISIDYAVMEKEAKNMYLLPADTKLDWNDVGGWVALEQYLKADDKGNRAYNKIEFIDCNNVQAMNYRLEHQIKIKNMSELVVVDTDNGLLICPKAESQRAKEIIPGLESKQKEILIDSSNNELKNSSDTPIALIKCEGLKIDYSREKLSLMKVGDTEEVIEEVKEEPRVEAPKEPNTQVPKAEEQPATPADAVGQAVSGQQSAAGEQNTEEFKEEEKVEEKKEEVAAEVPTEQQES